MRKIRTHFWNCASQTHLRHSAGISTISAKGFFPLFCSILYSLCQFLVDFNKCNSSFYVIYLNYHCIKYSNMYYYIINYKCLCNYMHALFIQTNAYISNILQKTYFSSTFQSFLRDIFKTGIWVNRFL